jgi:mannosylglycerate hydrolase
MTTIHLISHTHWDREWYLTFQQFHLKLIHLIDRLLDILEKDPEYKFFLLDGQTILLEDYLQVRADREPDLVRLIKTGRILIGPWYISPDEFLLSPESHVRNLLEGTRLCQKYGGRMPIGYLPDTFGHIGQMPQILQGFGIDYASMWRGISDQPVELTWKSPDGSSVLLSYLRESYGNAANLTPENFERFADEIHERSQALIPFSATGQILLMNGTDHMEPSESLTAAIRSYQEKSPEEDLRHSSLPLYFEAVRSQISASSIQLPVLIGELRSSQRSPLLPNTLSTRIWIKQRNFNAENNLIKWVEPLSIWSSLIDPMPSRQETAYSSNDHPYLSGQPQIIRSAWKMLMQCHPHDSICGTSIDQVHKEMQVRFDQVDQICHELTNQNLTRITDHINTTFPALSRDSDRLSNILSAIIVFNPTDQIQNGLVSQTITLDDHFSSFEILDHLNNTTPYQQQGLGFTELVSMTLDKKGLKQGLGMVQNGVIDGMSIKGITIHTEENKALIRATISTRGVIDHEKWKQILAKLDPLLADPGITEFIIHAFSDPEVDISFVAKDVPAHGYRCYWLRGQVGVGKKAGHARRLNPLLRLFLPALKLLTSGPLKPILIRTKIHDSANRPPRIENEFFILEAYGTDGTISLIDRRTQQVYRGLNRFVDGADSGDLYNYCPPERDHLVYASTTKIHQEETPVTSKLIVETEMLLPKALSPDRKTRSHTKVHHKLVSTFTLVHGVPRVDVHVEIDNQAHDHRLRVHFPAPFGCSTAVYDGHYELVERSVHLPTYDDTWQEQPRPEVPQREFTVVQNTNTSLMVANRGLPEVEVHETNSGNAEIALTLLRCVDWMSRDDLSTRKGHAGPMVATPDAQMRGRHQFDYSIIPGDDQLITSAHQAYAFNSPFRSVSSPIHPGSLPPSLSLIENSNPNFLITTIKSAENDSGMIVRGYNALSSSIQVAIKPFNTFKRAQLVNLAEKPVMSVPISPQGTINIQIEANKIITILFD